MSAERVQKILAQAGISSRRKAEELILEGAVTINGKVAQLGDKAEFGVDAIKVNGKLIHQVEEKKYYAFYKPKGVISMLADPEGRPTIQDFINKKIHERVFPVGRLDFNSEGLILLTNDGSFTEQVQKREDIPRVYQVKIKGHPEPSRLNDLSKGARVGDKVIRPHSVRMTDELTSKSQIQIVLLGSGAMDVKALCETKGFLVANVRRVAIGHITLKDLVPGEFKELKASQVEALLSQPELGMKRLEEEAEKATKKRPFPSQRPKSEEGKEEGAPRRAFGRGVREKEGFNKSRGPKKAFPAPRSDREERGSRPSFERGPRKSFGGRSSGIQVRKKSWGDSEGNIFLPKSGSSEKRDERAPRERSPRGGKPAFGAKSGFGSGKARFAGKSDRREDRGGGERREGGFKPRSAGGGKPAFGRGFSKGPGRTPRGRRGER